MEVQSDPKEEIYLNESNDNADFGRQTKGPVPGCWERTFPTGYLAGLKNIINLVWGLILVQFCQIALQPATIIFAGHLGKIELDTVALSITLMNITGYSVVIGMATACDTLFSQTYGSKNKKLVGIQVQRSLLIHFIALCICWALHLNIEGILRILGQDHEVSRLVGQYMLLFMPGMLCMFAYTILRKWVQCQNIVNPMIVVSAIGLGINIFLQWYLMYFKEWGLLGSVLALDITYILLLAMTMLYILISGVYKETWDGWDWRMFEDWGEFSRLALFGLLMTCLEWWAFEVTVLLAGTIGTTELGAQSLIFSVDGLIIGP